MDDKSTSAPAGLAGYFYQVDVSIYLALDLMLAQKRVTAITLEPANHEDLAADLADENESVAATHLTAGDYSMVVQSKLRNGEPWADTDIKTLLSKGKRRKSPKALLTEDAKLRYLLVTSAATKGVARDLSTRVVAAAWPPALPAGMKSKFPGLDGRVAILDGLDEQKLAGLIRDLLQTTCKVPPTTIPDCLEALRTIALDHMRHGPSVWTREALVRTITSFGGYLATAPEVGIFVKPTNWHELRTRLRARNGVIVTGSSGTGKTMAAEVLLDELRNGPDGAFQVIRVTHGPGQVWAAKDLSPVVFMIEDPWGKYRYHPEQRSWHKELDRMLNEARPDRRFIVTTRSDVLKEGGVERLAQHWYVPLETRHYGQRERYRLFDNRVRVLPETLKAPVDAHRDVVLQRLESPYEIQKFFDGLTGERKADENVPTFIRRCIDLAHYDAIENTIVDQVEARDDALPAIAVWGMLKALPRLSWTVIPSLASAIGEKDPALEDKIEPLIRFMAAGRNLRQPNDTVSYYHPRVEAGLERVLQAHKARAARVLGVLVDVLIEADGDADEDWGREAAARLVQGAKQDRVAVKVGALAQSTLDAYVRRRLTAPSVTLEADITLAADVGSPAETMAMFARWIGARGKTFGSMQEWTETPLSPSDAERMLSDPDVPAVAERFIREVLIRTNDQFPDDFAARLAVVAGDLSGAFRDAALRMTGYGFNWNAGAVGVGALANFGNFGPVVDAAIAENVRLRGEDHSSTWLEILNGEHSEGYAEHLADTHHDDGDTADNFLRLYVAELRRRSGWKSVAAHPDHAELAWAWIDVLREGGVVPQPDELAGLSDAVRDHRHEPRFWDLARDKWEPDLGPRLESRLKTRGMSENTRHAALKTMIVHAPVMGHGWVGEMAAADDLFGVLNAMSDLQVLARGYELRSSVQTFAGDAPAHAGPFERLARAVFEGATPALSEFEIERLEALDAEASPNLQLARARLLASAGRPVAGYIEDLLATTGHQREDIQRATAGLAIAIEAGLTDIVEQALKHRFADVRVDALETIAAGLSTPLPSHILAMAHDKGSGVRNTLVNILGAKQDLAHQPTLIGLTADSWSPAERYYGEEASYPIATGAAKLLGDQGPLFAEAIETLIARAAETGDPDLRAALLLAVAKRGDNAGRDRLADIALEVGRPALHAAAADALFRAGELSPARAARFDEKQLTERPASVAVAMSLAVGSTGETVAVLSLARSLRGNPDRSGLLVSMLFGAIYGEEGLADQLAALLPEEVRDGLTAPFYGEALAPRALLDPLGDFRIRGAVIDRLRRFFEPKAKEASSSRPLELVTEV